MTTWRTLGILVVLAAVAPVRGAETYHLVEAPQAGDCFQYQLEMNLAGAIRVPRNGQPDSLPLTATARHRFAERVLAVGPDGLPQKTARAYAEARAAITVQGNRAERGLRPDRSLLITERMRDRPQHYCLTGALTREELELTGEHLDTLTLTGLLPKDPVEVGQSWKVPNAVTQSLCNFEGLSEQNLTCSLESVKDGVAHIALQGTAHGIDLGAQVKLTIQGKARFDLNARRLAAVDWKQQDEREQGPASPALGVEVKTSLTRTPLQEPKELSDVALIKVPDGEAPLPLLQVEYRDPKGRFDVLHGRDWHVVGQTEQHLVLRLMDRGDFVAQATLTPWKRAEPGKHLSPEEFKRAMSETPGWEPTTEVQAGEVPSGDGRWVYRLAMQGQLDGVKVIQNFYLIAAPNGEQLVAAFTMAPSKAEKLGTRDLSLVGSLDFPGASREGEKK